MTTEDQSKKPRRSHEQAAAHRRYKRMRWIDGDGEWLCLFRCSDPWSYRLFFSQFDAECCATKPCGNCCKGRNEHRVWRVIPDAELQAREEFKNRTEPEPELSADSQAEFWEQKFHLDQ